MATAPTPTTSRLAPLAVVAAAVLFGTTGTAAALGPDDLSSIVTGSWRSVIGGITLVVGVAVARRPVWRHPLPPLPLLVGGAAVAVYQLAFFAAVERTGVAVGTIITIGTGPVAAMLLDRFVVHRRLVAGVLVGAGIAIAGVALLSMAGGSGVVPAGVLLAVVAGASYPVYGLVTQQLMADRPPVTAIATVFGVGAILMAPVAIVTTSADDITAAGVALVMYLGVATLAVAYALWAVGLRHLTLSLTVTITLVEPAVATVLAVVVLDEQLTLTAGVGVGLVVAGVLIASLTGGRIEPA